MFAMKIKALKFESAVCFANRTFVYGNARSGKGRNS